MWMPERQPYRKPFLYETGAIRSMGRVDHGDAHLDTDAMEKKRVESPFFKMARFAYGDAEYVLLDTPGHADFTAEMGVPCRYWTMPFS